MQPWFFVRMVLRNGLRRLGDSNEDSKHLQGLELRKRSGLKWYHHSGVRQMSLIAIYLATMRRVMLGQQWLRQGDQYVGPLTTPRQDIGLNVQQNETHSAAPNLSATLYQLQFYIKHNRPLLRCQILSLAPQSEHYPSIIIIKKKKQQKNDITGTLI